MTCSQKFTVGCNVAEVVAAASTGGLSR